MPLSPPTSRSPVVLFDSGELTATGTIDTGAGGFSSAYRVLEVFLYARETGAGTALAVNFRFNNDSGNNYDYYYVQGNNVTVSSPAPVAAANTIQVGLATGSTATAGRFGVTTLTVIDYAGTLQKAVVSQAWVFNAGGADAFSRVGGGQWRSNAAITRVATTDTLDLGSRMIIRAS